MLLIIEEGIRGGICQAILRYAKANNKYMKNYDKDKESSYIQDLDVNSMYGWAMSEPLPVRDFKWVKNVSRIDEEFIKNYDENGYIRFFLEVDIECSKELHGLHNGLPFLLERMKVNKCNKFVCNLYNKKNYVVHIRTLKEALNHGLKRVKLMINAVFGKPMENVRNHRDIKLVTTDKRRNQLVSEPDCHTIKCFSENLVAIEMRKTKEKVNKHIYLGMPILDISKIVMYEFWYDYVKAKDDDNVKLCYTDTDSFIFLIKQKIFMKILLIILKEDLIHQLMRLTDLCPEEKIKS